MAIILDMITEIKMDKILEIGKKYGIPVLEDSCEALGATYKGQFVGTLGDAGVFSLDFAKTITLPQFNEMILGKFQLCQLRIFCNV